MPDHDAIINAVREAYARAATDPAGPHPFPVGREFALSVGYPPELLDAMPSEAVESFAGLSNISVWPPMPEGARVLDLGCGVGLDAFVAARRVGACGIVVGLDFSAHMIHKAQRAASRAGVCNVAFVAADAQRMPFEDATFDLAICNGIFNLNPDRAGIFSELLRVLKPEGRAYMAEMVALDANAAPGECKPEDWFT